MSESLTQSEAGLRRVRFRCAKCGGPIVAAIATTGATATCAYCGSANPVPRGRISEKKQPTEGGAATWRIPARVAHEPYLDELRAIAAPRPQAADHVASNQRMRRAQRWRLAGLIIANAIAGGLTLAILGRAVGWW
jgi:hypothetical protein